MPQPYNVVENEAHFALECSLYNPIRDRCPSLFEDVILESLKSLFQLDLFISIVLLDS